MHAFYFTTCNCACVVAKDCLVLCPVQLDCIHCVVSCSIVRFPSRVVLLVWTMTIRRKHFKVCQWVCTLQIVKEDSQQMEHNPEAGAVAETLSQMAVPGEFSSNYDYTKEWVEQDTAR